MIFMGSAGSRIFLICARISTDFAAMSLPCSACAAVNGGFGTSGVCASRVSDAAHKNKIRQIMVSVPPLRYAIVQTTRREYKPDSPPSAKYAHP